MKSPVRVSITGAAGQIGYQLAFRIASGQMLGTDQPVILQLLEIPPAMDALKGVDRLILVGDHRQLPPIGPGRPFVDIVSQLTPENVHNIFPRVGAGYAELTVNRRQIEEIRPDIQLAEWLTMYWGPNGAWWRTPAAGQ